MSTKRLVGATLLLAVSACATIEEPPPAIIVLPYVSNFSESKPGEEVPQGWQNWTLSKFKKPTQYQLVTEGGLTVVKASANASASGLIHHVKLDPRTYPLLTWRWKVNELIAKADNTSRAGAKKSASGRMLRATSMRISSAPSARSPAGSAPSAS